MRRVQSSALEKNITPRQRRIRGGMGEVGLHPNSGNAINQGCSAGKRYSRANQLE